MTTIAVTTRAAATAIAAHTQPESPDEDPTGATGAAVVVAGGTGDEATDVDPGVLGGVDADAAVLDAALLDATELAGAGAAASSKRTSPCTG